MKQTNRTYPTPTEAEKILQEAEACNSGPWGDHSRVTAKCAAKIAALCPELVPEKAYVLGLLHDIGRKFGTRHLGHVYDGYTYMMQLGYYDVAKICLTHSFPIPDLNSYVGRFDITALEQQELENALITIAYDDYDRLIQLCDSISGPQGVMDIEERMLDVKRRYGYYPQEKWDSNLALKRLFENKIGKSIYEVLSELEMLKKLEESRKHVDQGMFKDADAVSRNMRTKYGL